MPEHPVVTLEVWSGKLSVHTASPTAGAAPALVGLSWVMQWPIPPLRPDQEAALLAALAPHAEALCRQVELVRGHDSLCGLRMLPGAGTAIDAILWKCAEMWQSGSRQLT